MKLTQLDQQKWKVKMGMKVLEVKAILQEEFPALCGKVVESQEYHKKQLE